MSYYGYARVSTQGQKNTSLDVQIEYLKKEAERLGEQFIPRKEKASAKNVEGRDVFSGLIKEVQKGDIIGVYDHTRFGRDTEDAIKVSKELYSKGVRIHISGQFYDPTSADAELMFTIHSAIATRERKIILNKSKASMDVKKRNGDWIFRGDLFGWEMHKRGDKVSFTIDETEAYYVRYIFEEHAKGRSAHSLEIELSDIHPNGCILSATLIGRMLQKPIYFGYYFVESGMGKKINTLTKKSIKGRLVKSNLYPPIISEDLFWKVQETWTHKSRIGDEEYGYRYSFHELSGIYRCPYCNVAAVYTLERNNYGKVTRDVYGLRRHKPNCQWNRFPTISAKLAKWATRASFIITMSNGYEVGKFFESERVLLQQNEEQLQAQIDYAKISLSNLDKQMKNIKDSIKTGILDISDFAEDIEQIKSDKVKLNNELSALMGAIESKNDRLEELMEISSSDMIDKYFGSDETGRRDILSKFTGKSYFKEDGWSISFLNGKRFEFEYPPKNKKSVFPIRFRMFFNDELQEEGTIDCENNSIVFDRVEEKDSFSKFYNDGLSELENRISDILRNCR